MAGLGSDLLTIYNKALALISVRPCTATNENTPQANACNLFWPSALKDTLRSNNWNFASAIVTLNQSSSFHPIGYDYAYDYPSDGVKIIKLFNDYTTDEIRKGKGEVFKEVWDRSAGRVVIVTDCQSAEAEYIVYVTDTTYFDSSFETSLVIKLAALICPSLVNDDDKMTMLTKAFNNSISEAQRLNADEETEARHGTSQFITGRGGAGPVSPKFKDGFSSSEI